MMNPSTYKKVAVASTFSPRFEQVLSEAGRIRERFGADLSLIYIGERNDETAKKFQEILGRLQLPGDSPVNCSRSEEHTSELQSRGHLVCRLLLEKKKNMLRSTASYQKT